MDEIDMMLQLLVQKNPC